MDVARPAQGGLGHEREADGQFGTRVKPTARRVAVEIGGEEIGAEGARRRIPREAARREQRDDGRVETHGDVGCVGEDDARAALGALPALTEPRSVHVDPLAELCHWPVPAIVEPVTAMLNTAEPSGSEMPVWVPSAVA